MANRKYLPIDTIGKTFGKWTVIDQVGLTSDYNCKCECGSDGILSGFTLNNGRSSQCSRCAKRTSLFNRSVIRRNK